jgi:1-acyl-sn-glycerol-3-phosphate acyltransferase
MILLRSVLFFAFLIAITPFYALAGFIVFPFMSAAKRYDFVRGWNVTVLAVAKVLCDIKYEVKGMENMTAMQNEQVILLSKTSVCLGNNCLLGYLSKTTLLLFKRELLFVPFLVG